VYFSDPIFPGARQTLLFWNWRNLLQLNKINSMAKEIAAKENPVVDALKKLKEEEAELTAKLKPLQEAIGALEKIIEKSAKKVKPAKENGADASAAEEVVAESVEEAQ
jgi:predicted  nucleic acid-binding Zn-ribbon protein